METRGYMQVAVDAVVFTIINNDLKILLIKRKNPPFKGKYAIPGGFVNKEEDLESAAKRELREETGWSAEHLQSLGSFFGSNGISNERFHLFLATGLRQAGSPRLEPTEQIELEFWPFERAVALVAEGGVLDAPSALALLLTQSALRRV